MDAIISFCGLCTLLVIGKAFRTAIPLLQRLYLPSSVIGGLVGLLILQLDKNNVLCHWTTGWNEIPGFLINVVFAALFLGMTTPNLKRVWGLAAPQFCFGQLLAWGQYAVGLGIVGFFLLPLFGVPAAFGNLLEIGFEGGHGTVAGLSQTFDQLGWATGKDLGFTMATIGMILGITLGMAMINFAARRGYIGNIRNFKDLSKLERRGIYRADAQPPAGKQTIFSDSIDSLAWHIAMIGLAVLIGYAIKSGLGALDKIAPEWLHNLKVLTSFPLFPLCMIGGLILQNTAERVHLETLIDHGQMQRISGAALDFLVVSAVASIRIDVVTSYWQPLLILALCGTLWNVTMVLFIAPKIFKEAWFERSIAEFGQSMGVTATGLLLLRTVDPESKTVASQAFGYKQLLHEPFMGGGLITSLALPLVFSSGWLPFWLFSVIIVLMLSFFAWRITKAKSMD